MGGTIPRKRVLNRRNPGEHKEVDKYKCFASFSAKTVDVIGLKSLP